MPAPTASSRPTASGRPPPPHAGARRLPDRRRGDERLRALRRVVRVAAARRGRPARPDGAGERADRRARPARRRRALADVAASLDHEMLYTGLTYCGHPLACAAGVAAVHAYEDERLIDRSRRLGAEMFAALRAMQARHAVIGDVRGGHGLFAVVGTRQGSRDAGTARAVARRAPCAALPRRPGARGGRVVRRPREPDRPRSAARHRGGRTVDSARPCWTACSPNRSGHDVQAHLLDDVQPAGGDARALRVGAGAGAGPAWAPPTRCTSTGRTSPPPRPRRRHGPIDGRVVLGRFPVGEAADVDRAVTAASRAFDTWRRTPVAERLAIVRRVAALIEERVYTIGAAVALEVGKNRMESLGETQETADFFRVYAAEFERNHGFDHRMPDDPLDGWASHNRSVLKPYGVWAVDHAVQLPARPGRRTVGRRARHRQHRRPEGRERHAVGRPPAGRLPARRGRSRRASSTT